MPRQKKEKKRKNNVRGEADGPESPPQENRPAPNLPKKGDKLKRRSEANYPRQTVVPDISIHEVSGALDAAAAEDVVREPLRSLSPVGSDAEAETSADRQRIAVLESQLPSTLYRRHKGQSFKVKVEIEPRPTKDDDDTIEDDDDNAVTTSSPLRPEEFDETLSANIEPHLRADWDFVDIAFATIPRHKNDAVDGRVGGRRRETEEADETDGLMPHVDPLRRGDSATVDRKTFKQRRDAIRAVPMRIGERRKIRQELLATELKTTRRIPVHVSGGCGSWCKKKRKKCGQALKEFFSRFVLWHGQLREIRCSHGLGIYAFFLFLRWLLFLNLLISIISAFIWMPFLAQFSLTRIRIADAGTIEERFETIPRFANSSSSSSSSLMPSLLDAASSCASTISSSSSSSALSSSFSSSPPPPTTRSRLTLSSIDLELASIYNQIDKNSAVTFASAVDSAEMAIQSRSSSSSSSSSSSPSSSPSSRPTLCGGALETPEFRALVCTFARDSKTEEREKEKDVGMKIVDVFQGTGWLSTTHLFLGAYHNITLNLDLNFLRFSDSFLWDSGLATISSVGITFLLSLFIILRSSSHYFSKTYKQSQGRYNRFSNLVLAGWDFNMRDSKAKLFKQTELFHQMRAAVRACKLHEASLNMRVWSHVRLHARRALIHVTCAIIIAGLLYAIVLVANFSWKESSSFESRLQVSSNGSSDSESSQKTKGANNFYLLLIDFLPSLLITFVNAAFPPLVDVLVQFELREPDSEVYFTLLRTVFLRLSSVFILAANFYAQISKSRVDDCGGLVDTEKGSIDCWENFIGAQMWKLVIMDLLASFLKSLVFDSLKRKAVEKEIVGKMFIPEFYIPGHVLDLMYGQTLCWMGMLFCPVIPIFTTMKIFLSFYFKKFTIDVNCQPSSKIYRPEKSQGFFRKLMLVSLFVSSVPVIFCISQMTPSRSCGPFRSQRHEHHMWDVLGQSLVAALPLQAKDILHIIFSSLILTVVVLLLFSIWLYYHAKGHAMEGLMTVLHEMLQREEENRRHLLRRAQKLTKRRWRRKTDVA